MKLARTLNTLVAGATLATALWTGAAHAEDQFQALAGITAEAISQNDMATVQGKLVLDLGNLLGSPTVVKLLEPGQLLSLKLLGLSLGGTPSSSVGLLNLNLLGLSL